MTTKPPFTIATWNDAGLLREYTVAHYGQTLTCGGYYETMRRAMRMVRRMAALARVPVEEVLAAVQFDYEATAE
jgi:hypothetical protein